MEPWQTRLLAERDELLARISALAVFISDDPVFPTLHEEDQRLLRSQHAAMRSYHVVLRARIARF